MHITERVLTGLLATALLVGWTAVGTGCSCNKTAEEGAEKAIEKGLAKDGGAAKVKIDAKSGTMQMKGKDASGNDFEIKTGGDKDTIDFKQTEPDGTVTQMGASAKLPDDFPKDVPMLEGLELRMVQIAPERKGVELLAKAAVPLAKAAAFYKEKAPAQGWKETTSMDDGEMQSLVYEKGERMLSLTLMQEDGGTVVSMQLGEK